MGFAEQRFANDSHLCAGGTGFDGGAQTSSACSDH